MFHLHETTRRRLGRAAFIALCAAPTLAIAAWIAWRLLPGGDDRASRRLSAALHIAAAATDWREPRPDAVRAAALAFSDPVDGARIVAARAFEWRRHGARSTASVDLATIECDRLDRLAPRLDAWLEQIGAASLQIRCRQAVFHSGEADKASNSFALEEVRVDVERDAAGCVHLRMTGRAAGQMGGQRPIQLTIERAASNASPLHVALDTAGIALPASLLASAAPGFDRLGDGATFTGVVSGHLDGGEFVGAAAGRLERVDLAAALPEGSPHTARGEANIELSELRWRGDRVELLAGRIDARDALVSPSLTAAAAEYMRCPHERAALAGGLISGRDALVAVDRLQCRFRLDGAGLLLEGDFAAEEHPQPGCLATSGGRPVLFEPGGSPMPTGAWIQFLFGPSQSWLPATRQAVDVAERLPLPGGTMLR